MSGLPLHKRLDAILRDPRCSPEDVVSMLSGTNSDIMRDVIRNSFEIRRCYQLDFFYMCGKPELKWLMSSLDSSGNPVFQNYFMWQILMEDSSKAAFLKYDYRALFRKWKRNCVLHPYAFGNEKYVKDFDQLCRKTCRDRLPFCDIAVSEWMPFSDCVDFGHSLFQGRIFSTDVFLSMPPAEQWKFLSAMPRSQTAYVFKSRFVLSMIEDSRVMPEICVKAVESLVTGVDPWTCALAKAIPENVLFLLKECGSFGEFNLRRNVGQGMEDVGILVRFLLFFRPEWLLEWYDVDGEEVDSILRCRSTTEALVRSRK